MSPADGGSVSADDRAAENCSDPEHVAEAAVEGGTTRQLPLSS